MAEEKGKSKEAVTAPGQPLDNQGSEQEPEKDRLDELLADVPEWLRGPIKQYYRQILVTIALVLVVSCLLSGYAYYVRRQETAASFQLGLAMSTTNIDKKIEELKKIQNSFSHTSAARLAGLLIGQVYLQTGDWDSALDAFKRAEGDFSGIMADTAHMGQGYSLEEKKSLNEALTRFKDVAARKNGMEAVATLDEARVYQELGKKEEAVSAYDRYLDLEPKSPLLDFIRFQVMNLSS